jgi:predicted dehydrogenase
MDVPPTSPTAPDRGPHLDRRSFIGAGSAMALGLLMGGGRVYAEEFVPAPTPGGDGPVTPVGCAVIGLGEQGRALLTALTNVPGADIRMVCDHYAGAHARALEIVPKATAVAEAKAVLDDATVQAVWIATPTHLHKELAIAALQAGKHVYCEMPMAGTIEDARAIAKAAQAAGKQVFHAGLQQRTDPQHLHVVKFVRTGALGKLAQARGFWHRRTSWRRAAASDQRQQALNWRLAKATSTGLMGEVGIHHVDVASWYIKALPQAVTGFGGIMAWADGREVHDTVQCVLEFPGGVRFSYDATLANSYDGAGELFQGSEAAVLLRDHRAWMFKETDAPALGWEVYAFREKVGDETGIALVADATKILAAGKQPGENREVDPRRTPLACACEAFLAAVREQRPSACNALTGFQATVTALKAHEATATGSRIVLQPEWYQL